MPKLNQFSLRRLLLPRKAAPYIRTTCVGIILGTYQHQEAYTSILAHYDPLEQVEPVGSFEHDEPGHRADPAMPNLLGQGVEATELSPHCGTELLGVQIVGFVPIQTQNYKFKLT